MPEKRVSMRKIREVLRLHHELGLSERQIATSCQIAKTSVSRYLKRAKQTKLTWPLPENMDDHELEQRLFPHERKSQYRLPDFSEVHKGLKRRGVTLFLLWEEYKSLEPTGLSYGRFCYRYREFASTLSPVMRQTYKAGEKCFVDYAGQTLEWIDANNGEIHKADIFVATLGASSYTFAEAVASQQLPDWIASHVRAFKFFGGVPEILVPDNLKSGVTKAHHYDPDINPTYQDMANHYGIAIVPARAGEPRDKAKVEAAVKHIEQRILAKLRHHTFFSIADINAAIAPLLTDLNEQPFQKYPGSRLSEFIEMDKPALKPLPVYPYEYAAWKKVRVNIDYHIAIDTHYYSVPYQYCKQELDCKITHYTIQCFLKSKLIATHRRAYNKGHTTIKEHMPKAHQAYAEWTPERIINWAKQSGEHTQALITAMIESRSHPQQAFRACLGVLRLGKHHGTERLEKAAKRALKLGTLSYQSIESILKYRLEDQPLPESVPTPSVIAHEHLRGGDYFC